MLKCVPNILSALRFLAAAALLFTAPFSALFYVLYFFCGISDIADGFLARRLNAESDFGARLDSAADFAFVIICIVKLWRYLAVPMLIWLWIAAIAAMKIISLLTARIKSGSFGFHHTFLNRLTGFLLFVSVPFIRMRGFWILAALLCIIATCAAVEENIINWRGDFMKKGLNSNALKLIAIIAMTIDHIVCVVFPNYPTDWWIIGLHILGRITAPIMWFFIAEGYHYTRNLKKYAVRLFAFALISHFAYNFAFGIPFIPFQTSVFNQTSVIWPLAWGLVALAVNDSSALKTWQKTLIILAICAVTFCSDWSCIAVLAIVGIGSHRGDFKRQMTEMMTYVFFYALVYFIFVNKIYGVVQMFAALSIPLLKAYNGERGKRKGMKWFFYFYYPAHLVLCGIIRIWLHGNIGVMIGG